MATRPDKKKTAKSSGTKPVAKRAATQKSAKPVAGKPAKKRPVATPKAKAKSAPTKAANETRKVAEKKARNPRPGAAKKPGKTAATPAPIKDLRPFRRALLSRQAILLEAYHAAKGESRSEPSAGTEDYIDYAVSSYAREFSLSLTEMEQKQLHLVEDALKRIAAREYGRCLSCRQAILTKRLEVEPWARHCIRCQELEEQGMLEPPDFDDDDDDVDDGGGFRGDEEEETEQGMGAWHRA